MLYNIYGKMSSCVTKIQLNVKFATPPLLSPKNLKNLQATKIDVHTLRLSHS